MGIGKKGGPVTGVFGKMKEANRRKNLETGRGSFHVKMGDFLFDFL